MTTNIERDSENKTAPPPAKAKRRWFAFSLRTLLIATALLSCVLGYFGNILLRVRHQRAVIAKIEAAGATVYLDHEVEDKYDVPGTRIRPAVVRWIVGDDAFSLPELAEWPPWDADLSLLLELPELRQLRLSGENVTDREMEIVSQLKHLMVLELNDAKVTGQGIKKLAGLQSLRVLGIGSERSFYKRRAVECNHDELLQGIGELRNLESLRLYPASSATSDGLSYLQPLTNLKYLEINRATQLTDDGLRYLQGMKSLEDLTLNRCSIRGDGLAHLADLPRLSTLSLYQNPVTDEGLVHIAKCRNLRILSLSKTHISDRGITYLATPESATAGETFGAVQKLARLERLLVGLSVSKEVALVRFHSTPSALWAISVT